MTVGAASTTGAGGRGSGAACGTWSLPPAKWMEAAAAPPSTARPRTAATRRPRRAGAWLTIGGAGSLPGVPAARARGRSSTVGTVMRAGSGVAAVTAPCATAASVNLGTVSWSERMISGRSPGAVITRLSSSSRAIAPSASATRRLSSRARSMRRAGSRDSARCTTRTSSSGASDRNADRGGASP
jgi:hypothetical protein